MFHSLFPFHVNKQHSSAAFGFPPKPSAGATAAPSRIARLENEGQVNLIMPIRSTSAPIKKRGLFFSAKQLLLVLIVRLEVFFLSSLLWHTGPTWQGKGSGFRKKPAHALKLRISSNLMGGFNPLQRFMWYFVLKVKKMKFEKNLG